MLFATFPRLAQSSPAQFLSFLLLLLLINESNGLEGGAADLSLNATTSSSSSPPSTSSDLVPQMASGATEAMEVPASILDANVDSPLEQYFWERVHEGKDCPLNCSTPLQCWRLAGYLIPFICLPAGFDPNIPSIGQREDKNWLNWVLSLTNAELVILALLVLNTFVGLSTCFCICARRKCLGAKF